MFKLSMWVAIVLTIFIVKSSVGQRYISNAVHPDHPGKCFYNETQTPIEIGSTYRPTTECLEIKCRDDFVLSVNTCPRYVAGTNCHVTFEEGVEYPGCCAKVKCPQVKQF